MYLHKDDKELLRDIIVTVSERTGIDESIVEKDYYVTMILKELVQRNPNVVFKGGTSLSKAYHAIDLAIDNWKFIESDKDYNHYDFLYDSVCSEDKRGLRPYVKLETALMSYSYPTEEKEITSIIFDCLATEEAEILRDYGLEPFKMKTQALSRTIIDKIFAVCDYYMVGRATRNSRHLYDIFKLKNYISMDDDFKRLFADVRKHRSGMDIKITPSAREDVDLLAVAEKLIREDFYADDYADSTMKLISDNISYETVKLNYIDLVRSILR